MKMNNNENSHQAMTEMKRLLQLLAELIAKKLKSWFEGTTKV